MDLRPIASSYSQINQGAPQNQTHSPSSGLASIAKKADQKFTFFCNDSLGRFCRPQGGHVPTLIVSDKTAKRLGSQDVGIGQLWLSEARLIEIFSEVQQRLERRLYSASELTEFIYKSDLKIDPYFSCAIYGFFQDALENTRFCHPDWIQDKSNGRIGIRSSHLMEWIEDLVKSGRTDSTGNRYINIFLLDPSHNTKVQYTCVKLERGILKYSSSLEPLIKKLLDFQPSRALINHALKDRKITIISATPRSSVGYNCNYDNRALLINDQKSNDAQLGYTLRGISDFLAAGKMERIQAAFANGELNESAFIQRINGEKNQALKLYENVINLGVEANRWSMGAFVE